MAITSHERFDALLYRATIDDNILGFFLKGSRGKGFENEHSDYDLAMVVKNDAAEAYKKEFDDEAGIDLALFSLSELETYASWNGPNHWDRYDFAHVRALVDKTGQIQELIDRKGSIPDDKRDEYINRQLDAYINGFFRSVKAFRRNDAVGMRLESAASIPHLLNALFALEGRVAPFAGYLVQELERRPLQTCPWSSAQLAEALLRILESGDLRTQQTIARTVEKTFRQNGYGNVFDAWKGEDRWAMDFAPGTKE
jgi:hypothetical protein